MKLIVVDIDGTVCSQTTNQQYESATPYYDRIEYINTLYDQGNVIIYWTARGMGSDTVDKWRELTRSQLDQWGCRYHRLEFSKPRYDVWIDDKAEWPFE